MEAATLAKQWSKAAQIADALEDNSVSKQYYGKIAEHYAEIGDLEVNIILLLVFVIFDLITDEGIVYSEQKCFMSKPDNNGMLSKCIIRHIDGLTHIG